MDEGGSIRKAGIKDVKQMQALINGFARKDRMLPRSLYELYENIRDFWVFERGGAVRGCAAMHISWDDLAEIKSVAVADRLQSKGIGTRLVEACLEEAKALGARRVFVLTYSPDFFKKMGFRRIKNSLLPHKIWAECINCPKFPDCDEIPMLKVIAK